LGFPEYFFSCQKANLAEQYQAKYKQIKPGSNNTGMSEAE